MPNPHRGLESFAQQLAPLLPGPRWRAEYTPFVQDGDQYQHLEALWDTCLLSAAVTDLVLEDSAVLTQEVTGTRLYVVRHLPHPDQFLIGAFAPEVFPADAYTDVASPNAIAVPDDAPTAARALAQDLLVRYQAALEQVRRNHAGPTPDEVVMTWHADGALTATVTSGRALSVLLHNGFHYDPEERVYVLPGTDPTHQARQVRWMADRLDRQGIGLVVRHPPKSRSAAYTRTTPPAPPTGAPAHRR